MPTTPSKSKYFLAGALGILVILIALWAIFRTPTHTTPSASSGETKSGFLKTLFGGKQKQETATNQGDLSTIPHGHGDDTPEEQQAFIGNGAPEPHTGACNLFNTGIMDNDCDGIPNWLEERNRTNAEDPNNPYKQGGWNHDKDTIFHGMDGHYACDAYNNRLLNCEKNITSEVEAITDIQDTDKGGVPDVMEIIKNMNPLDPCDDMNTCTAGNGGLDENGNPIIINGGNGNDTLAVSLHYDDNDPRQHIQLTLQSLMQEMNTNQELLDNFTHGDNFSNGEVIGQDGQVVFSDTDEPFDMSAIDEYQQELLDRQEELNAFLDNFSQWQDMSVSELPLEEINNFGAQLDFYAQNSVVFSNQLQLDVPPILQAYEGWVNRQSVHIDIDLEQSSFREGKLRLYGFIDTNGFANLPVELRYTDITNAPYAQAYRNYCFARANLGFHQTDLGSGNNFIQDILGIINTAGKYQSTSLEFTYINPQTGSVTHSNRATTAPGQRIPFSASIDNLKIDGLYSFALVDPSIIVPIRPPVHILGQDVHLNINITLPDPTNILSSFIFSGPSCFDYLNRFIPAATLDVDASSLVGGGDVDTATNTPQRNGVATVVGTLSVNTTNKISPVVPTESGGGITTSLYMRYGSPKLETITPTLPFSVSQGFRFIISNIHQDDWFALYDAGTNSQILGPYQFKTLNSGLNLSRFEERWYYIASYTPPTRSYYYMSEQQCLSKALSYLGRSTPCYKTAIKSILFDVAVPMGVEDSDFDAAVKKEKGREGNTSLVGQTKIYLSGFIDTKGNDVDLAIDMIGIPYVEERNGEIVYLQGQDKEVIVASIDPSDFKNAPTPYQLPNRFHTNPGQKVPFSIPVSTVLTPTTFFKPGYIYVFTLQDAHDPKSIYYMGNVTTYLHSPAEVTGGEIGTTTLSVDPGLVVEGGGGNSETPLGNDVEGDPNYLWNPLDIVHVETIPQLVTHVFKVAVKIILPLVGLAFIYLAFLFITAGKNPTKQATAYNTLKMMGYGAGILLIAYVLGLAMDSVIQCLAKGICF